MHSKLHCLYALFLNQILIMHVSIRTYIKHTPMSFRATLASCAVQTMKLATPFSQNLFFKFKILSPAIQNQSARNVH
jgi:hypothetical protein